MIQMNEYELSKVVIMLIGEDLKIKKNILIASIIRKNQVIIPSGLDTLEPLDSVIIVSSSYVIKDVNDILG